MYRIIVVGCWYVHIYKIYMDNSAVLYGLGITREKWYASALTMIATTWTYHDLAAHSMVFYMHTCYIIHNIPVYDKLIYKCVGGSYNSILHNIYILYCVLYIICICLRNNFELASLLDYIIVAINYLSDGMP